MSPTSEDLISADISISIQEKILEKNDDENDELESKFNFEECDCTEMTHGDAVFSMVIVAPCVVTFWRGTWGIMDIHSTLFPHAQIFLMGITVHICFTLVRSYLFIRSAGAWSGPGGGAVRWIRERLLSRVYTYIFALACVMHWKGGWGLIDMFVDIVLPDPNDVHRPVIISSMLVLFYLSAVVLRSSRNFLSPPYFLVTDGKEPTYRFTTYNKMATLSATISYLTP